MTDNNSEKNGKPRAEIAFCAGQDLVFSGVDLTTADAKPHPSPENSTGSKAIFFNCTKYNNFSSYITYMLKFTS